MPLKANSDEDKKKLNAGGELEESTAPGPGVRSWPIASHSSSLLLNINGLLLLVAILLLLGRRPVI